MNEKIDSSVNFYSLMQWLSKNDKIQLNSYKLKAFVSYETDRSELSFYNREQTVIVSTDSQNGGRIFLPDVDTDVYHPEFVVNWQDFLFDERKEELVICSQKPSCKFSKYCVTIRNMQKLDFTQEKI